MPTSWAVTGASRGLGLAFVLYLSAQYPNDIVIGIVRNKSNITQASHEQLDHKNLHFVEADISDSSAASKAADTISSITGGTLDVLINNAAYNSPTTRPNKPSTFIANPELLKREMEASVATNVLGTMFITNCLVPLLKKGSLRKLITISSGNAVRNVVKDCNTANNVTYASTKATLDHIMLMYSIELKTDGIVVLGVSPGWVNTSGKECMSLAFILFFHSLLCIENTYNMLVPTDFVLKILIVTEEDYEKFKPAIDNFKRVYPWNGKILEPIESVKMILDVIQKSTIEDTGNVVSHYGNQTLWL